MTTRPGHSATDAAPTAASPPRSRRALLAGLLGGAGAAIATAVARVSPVKGAAGDPLILGQSNFAGDSATRLFATSSGGAFWMTQNGSGSGVRGESISGTGGVFETKHADRYGLLAQNIATSAGSGAGLRAIGNENKGIFATSDTIAVDATGSSIGVRGVSTSGIGVRGQSSSDFGVFGTSSSHIGVRGTSTNLYGVSGFSTNSHGVFGAAGSGNGVNGVSSTGAGVFGTATGGGLAGQFQGNVTVSGTLSKGGGSFKIDHPLDPANKYLSHSFVESPDMLNVYNGGVVTDGRGTATVSLPDWFEALNREVRYQLTPVGRPMPDLHVSREVKDGRFSIAGAAPNAKVSWQLTGVRQDAWARANRIPLEEDKVGSERGRYLHPELFGRSAELSVAAARTEREAA